MINLPMIQCPAKTVCSIKEKYVDMHTGMFLRPGGTKNDFTFEAGKRLGFTTEEERRASEDPVHCWDPVTQDPTLRHGCIRTGLLQEDPGQSVLCCSAGDLLQCIAWITTKILLSFNKAVQ